MQGTEQIRLGQLVLEMAEAGSMFDLSNIHSPDRQFMLEGLTFEVDGRARGGFAYVGPVLL